MTRIDKLKELIKDKEYISSAEIVSSGLDRMIIKDAIDAEILYKVRNGLYSTNNVIDDMFYIIQNGNNVIYSNETALYLHGVSDRTPRKYSLSVVQGSSSNLLIKYNNIKKYYVSKKNFELGEVYIMSPYGNLIRSYDLERTIVDIIKNESRIDRQIYTQAIRYYMSSNIRNIQKVLEYAKELKCLKKVQNILSLFSED